jgi:hypothetical protein
MVVMTDRVATSISALFSAWGTVTGRPYSFSDIIDSIYSRMDWRSLLSFSLPFSIYLLTIAPTIYNLDSAELTTAAYTGGLVRATGYPLYLVIGNLWSHLPVGDVGFRMNLFSAVCGALTILLAERILRRWKIGNIVTFGALGLLATSTYFWGLSLVAEVYTLHTALMAGFILALLRWSDRPAAARMFWVSLLAGLGFAHHAAMVLLAPAGVMFILLSHPRELVKRSTIGAAIAGIMLGLSAYIYLPLRYLANPAFNYSGSYDVNLIFHPVDLTTLDGLLWLITGRAFSGVMMAYQGIELWREAQSFLVQLGRAFFAAGIGPGLLGIVLLFRRSWREGLMLLLMFIFSAGFYINYRVLDKDTMYLPAYLVWALWLAVGYQGLLDWMKQAQTESVLRYAQLAGKVLIVGFVLFAMVWNWRIVDLSNDWTTRERGEEILERVEADAIIFGWWDSIPVVEYLQFVEGKRPDVQAVNRFLISEKELADAIQKEADNRPIYIDGLPRHLSARLVAIPDGPVYRVIPRQDHR